MASDETGDEAGNHRHDGRQDRRRDGILALFLRHRSRLERLLFRRTGCHADAADLAQELFLRLWSRRPETAGAPPLGESAGYLFRSARNLAVDHARAEEARGRLTAQSLPIQHYAEPTLPDDACAARADLAVIEETLRRLPGRTRHVFLLNRVHGRTYDDIARALGVSVSTVEKDMMRALSACKACVTTTGDGR